MVRSMPGLLLVPPYGTVQALRVAVGEFRITAFFLLTIKAFFENLSGLNAYHFVWTRNSRRFAGGLSSARTC